MSVTFMSGATKNMADFHRIFNEEMFVHADALANFAYHLTYDDTRADDLVQETYLKAFRSIDKYEVGTNAKAWLFKIMKNAFINQYRKKSKRPQEVDFDKFSKHPGDEEDPQYSSYLDLREEIYDGMMGDEVTQAINSLDLNFRTIILLCDVEGFKYEEIAKILDIPIGTVRSRLHRARNELKQKLSDYAQKMGFYKPDEA